MDEHKDILTKLFRNIPKEEIKEILDAGSGRTSLNNLISYFDKSNIDAIVYYNDDRKKNSIKENVKGKYALYEKDIVKDTIFKKYDLVLAHLLLGEALKFNNTVEDVLESLFKINTKYLIIVDIKEDPTINYEYLLKQLNKYDIIDIEEVKKLEPQVFKNFVSRNYIGYLIKKY